MEDFLIVNPDASAHPAMVLLPYLFLPLVGFPVTRFLVLPLSGIRFFPYLMCGWLIQGIMGVPFVIMGKALIHWDMKLLAVVGMIVLVIFLFRHKIRDMYRGIMNI